MSLLRSIKYFKIFLILFLSCNTFAVPEEISNPPVHDFDFIQDAGADFNLQGSVTFEGDNIQTSSGMVVTQRKRGVLLWEDIPFDFYDF